MEKCGKSNFSSLRKFTWSRWDSYFLTLHKYILVELNTAMKFLLQIVFPEQHRNPPLWCVMLMCKILKHDATRDECHGKRLILLVLFSLSVRWLTYTVGNWRLKMQRYYDYILTTGHKSWNLYKIKLSAVLQVINVYEHVWYDIYSWCMTSKWVLCVVMKLHSLRLDCLKKYK